MKKDHGMDLRGDTKSGSKLPQSKEGAVFVSTWAHSPTHVFVPGSTYMVTAGIYEKRHLLDTDERKTLVLSTLLEQASTRGWRLEAWAVMVNHYHFVGQAPEQKNALKALVQAVHSLTARELNTLDNTPGRQVWFQYRDTLLTYEKSYLARLNYVHQNPLKHGVVPNAELYPWCSMGWFLREATPGFRKTVQSFKCDRVNVADDY